MAETKSKDELDRVKNVEEAIRDEIDSQWENCESTRLAGADEKGVPLWKPLWDNMSFLADLYDDRGDRDRAEGWRWLRDGTCVPFLSGGPGEKPLPEKMQAGVGRFTWFNHDAISYGLSHPYSDLPLSLYEKLEAPEQAANHKKYPSLTAAFDAVVKCYPEFRELPDSLKVKSPKQPPKEKSDK